MGQQQEKQSFIKYDLNKNGSMDFQVANASVNGYKLGCLRSPQIARTRLVL